jgi:two-component system, NarL family, response regulator LiaR
MRSETSSTEITIVIADDHQLVRDGIRAYLHTQPDLRLLAEAGDGANAIEAVTAHAPDVVLLDLVMPGMDGVEAARRIKLASPRTQIIILTSFDDDRHALPAIKAGALSYLLKDTGPAALGSAIRSAARGESVLHPRIASLLVGEVRSPTTSISVFAELSERELDVLKLIADGANNAEIAARLFIAEGTVKGHVSNILNKLHLADRTQAAVLAWQQGLKRTNT